MSDDLKPDKSTVNGVPVNNAPVPSNPQTPTPAKKRESDAKKSTDETTATSDVVYDVPPADLDN